METAQRWQANDGRCFTGLEVEVAILRNHHSLNPFNSSNNNNNNNNNNTNNNNNNNNNTKLI